MSTPEQMLEILKKKGKSFSTFHKGTVIHVNDKMQKNYSYTLEEEPGQNLAFKPYATPEEMLCMGVFEGKYMNDCLEEYPMEWFIRAISLGKLSPQGADPSVNAFGIKSRQNLSVWRENNWVPSNNKTKKKGKYDILSNSDINKDNRGWFEWFCRYFMGRRIPELDKVQIARWKAISRHTAQIKKNCKPGDLSCRPRQRQLAIQWSHNPFI